MKTNISISIDEDLLKKIEKKRGLVDRSTFIDELLKKHIGDV